MKRTKRNSLLAVFLGLGMTMMAKENITSGQKVAGPDPLQVLSFDCTPATAQAILELNNVRTTILGGGDMWWNLTDAQYEIPNGSNKHSLYAGALWIGGMDDENQLKVAAMTYRQTGNDFWPGPLDSRLTIPNGQGEDVTNPGYGATSSEVCVEYNKHFRITRQEVDDFIANPADGIPQSILDWPGNRNDGNPNEQFAPFFDSDDDGFYDPGAGDYPRYGDDNSNCNTDDLLYGDETIWWVFNDKGNIHTESSAEGIGLEIQAQAFAFSTNDEINDMTFYSYKIVNRSREKLNSAYFGQWVDPDLGNFQDDYVGCDVERGLGYCYNGDPDDETVRGYGANPPAIGVDFFRGPAADIGDGIDNDRDGCIDGHLVVDPETGEANCEDESAENRELIIMSKFVYYNNVNNTPDGNPNVGPDFYNYLRGIWLDNRPITYGGDGRSESAPPANFMFPGDTDPSNEEFWTEETAGNDPADRRFLQTAGPFTLAPGAVNTITTGVVWARATSGGAFASVEKMRLVDDKAQSLFDNCFEVLNGPDAPDLAIQELPNQLIITLSNKETSNNYKESYLEIDPTIVGFYGTSDTPLDNAFRFEGYQIFQVTDETVTATDLYDLDKARLIFQSDIENYRNIGFGEDAEQNLEDPIGKLVNYIYDADLDADVPENMTISADNLGIRHSLSVTQDQFTGGGLLNNRTYYFIAVAYGYNEFIKYKVDTPLDEENPAQPSSIGQRRPFKAGRKNLRTYSGTPNKAYVDYTGEYGTIPEITRVEGYGNGGLIVELNEESIQNIIDQNCVGDITYLQNAGPVQLSVLNPKNVMLADYELIFDGIATDSNWELIRTSGEGAPVSYTSDQAIGLLNEQIIPEIGLSIAIKQVEGSGPEVENNGLLNASITYENDAQRWLTGVQDEEYPSTENWIWSGTTFIPDDGTPDEPDDFIYADMFSELSGGQREGRLFYDPNSIYEGLFGGNSWIPYRLAGSGYHLPAHQATSRNINNLDTLTSVNIVYTSDKNLWTRVPVLDADSALYSTVSRNNLRLRLKQSPSVDKEGNADGTGTGFSWFPGYAIDIDRGIRLNMAFAENSALVSNNGDDMMWNPTDSLGDIRFDIDSREVIGMVYGGMHFTYVCHSEYQGPDSNDHPFLEALNGINEDVSVGVLVGNKRAFFGDIDWVSIPLLQSGYELNSTDIEVKLRVQTPYTNWADCTTSNENGGNPKYGFSTESITSETPSITETQGPLDAVQVVPNPYYGYSTYETGQIDNRIKITNLPERCNITVYSMAGTLIRQEIKDNLDHEWEWNLKNNDNITISSGMYIIHVDGLDLGEKVLKWFGALRPVDLDTF